MQGIRKAGQSWLGRIVVGVLFGILILSFAIWGIGDMLRQQGKQVVARVGSTEITAQTFRDAYQTELQNLARRARRSITHDEARAYGLDRQVLNRLIAEAALDERVKSDGLAMSDEAIAKAILADDTFRGPGGRFDRNVFNEVLRNNGLTEPAFVRAQRAVYLRQQLADALAGGVPVPSDLREALHRYQNETRAIASFTLKADQLGEIAAPDQAQLQAFFDARKASFRAPETRKVSLLTVSAEDLAKADAVPEAEVKAFYARNPARFGSPGRRSVKQIVFPTSEEANAAYERLAAGTPFETLAEERKLAPADVDLGLVTRDGIVDQAVAEAAFGLKEPGIAGPVKGQFGTAIVKVDAIQPEDVKPLAEVEPAIRRELAIAKARAAVQDVHDRIEDQRASARPLAEIAKEAGLPLRLVDGVDRNGRDRAGRPIDLPDREALLKAIFASDLGVDNEALATRDGGWIWFEINGVDPARDRTLDEVKDEIAAAWKAERAGDRVADKAAELLKSLRAGTTLEAAAASIGAEVKTTADIKRQAAPGGLSPATVAQVFATPVGQFASAIGANPQERVLLQVTGAQVPPFVSSGQAAAQLDEQLRLAISDDILSAYIARLQAELGVTLNEALIRQAAGGTL